MIDLDYFEDERGYFCETYSQKNFKFFGIDNEFVQDCHSFNAKKYTFRGIHFQNNPASQAKIVRCINGEIMDFVVDLRKSSPTYLSHKSIILSKDNRKCIFIPSGFGHAYLTLCDNCEILYKMDKFYDKNLSRTINFKDPKINLVLPSFIKFDELILSQKDIQAPNVCESDVNFE